MNIILACDDRFVPFCSVVIKSTITYNENVNFYIFSESLSEESQVSLNKIVKASNNKITIISVDKNLIKTFPLPKGDGLSHISIATYFRLFSTELLPELDKAIYLDCDILVRGSLIDLWNTDIEGYYLAAVYHQNSLSLKNGAFRRLGIPISQGYFNAGVLLMNLKKWKEDCVYEHCLEYISKNFNNIRNHDQDVLNAVCGKKVLMLPCKWNMQNTFYKKRFWEKTDDPYMRYYQNELKETIGVIENSIIVHFAARPKPWEWYCNHPFRKQFLDTLDSTGLLLDKRSFSNWEGFIQTLRGTLLGYNRYDNLLYSKNDLWYWIMPLLNLITESKRKKMERNNKRILWITPDWFLDCDIDLVPKFSSFYDICWIILLPYKHSRYSETDILAIAKSNPTIRIIIIHLKYRVSNFRNYFDYRKILEIYKELKPNIIYINHTPSSPWILPILWRLPKQKLIITAHQGKIHKGFEHKFVKSILWKLHYATTNVVNMFSKSQADIFQNLNPKHKVFTIPLALKYFGEPKVGRNNSQIMNILSFGTINYGKHIDLLVDAVCNIYDKGYKNIKVTIKGMCKEPESVLSHVRYPDIFDIDFRLIDNSEIPTLFTYCNFFIQPYRIVTQSGPLKIAYRYNTPVISSNLPGFADEMKDNVTGFTFQTEDVNDLEKKLIQAINTYSDSKLYARLLLRESQYVEEHFSDRVILMEYQQMFNCVLNIQK